MQCISVTCKPSATLQEARLADAQQCFEREQAAVKDALRSFAPGFGAGKLLANALARRSAKVWQGKALHG